MTHTEKLEHRRRLDNLRERGDHWRSQAFSYALKCELLEEQLRQVQEGCVCGSGERSNHYDVELSSNQV
jgi:hypothetical protein